MNTSKGRIQESGNESSNEKESLSPINSKSIIDDSSSSESDIESYLQKPKDLNLKSTFFKTGKSTLKTKRKSEGFNKSTLSDSDSDDPLSVYVSKDNESLSSTSKAFQRDEGEEKIYNPDAFKQLNKQMHELEEMKKYVEAYQKRKDCEKVNDVNEVDDLLAAGEKFDLSKDLADVGFHPSDFESGNESEKNDWEEVTESPEKSIIPKEGVQITVNMPTAIKKKKGVDLMAALKRRMNRIRKENQVYIHKVHLLCWIAHGNYINDILNKQNVLAMALSLLPTKDCYPPVRTNLKYLEQISIWYKKAIQCKFNSDDDKNVSVEEQIMNEISAKIVTKPYIFVYIFIAMLRALGMQCRLVLSLQVEPLRPPAQELYSLANDNKAASKKSEENINKKKGKNADVSSSKPVVEKAKVYATRGIKSSKSSKISKKDESAKEMQTKKISKSSTAVLHDKSPTMHENRSDFKSPENLKKSRTAANAKTVTKESKTPENQIMKKPNLGKLKSSTKDEESTEAKSTRPARSRGKNSLGEGLQVPCETKEHKKMNELHDKNSKTLRSKSASTIQKAKATCSMLEINTRKQTDKRSKSDSRKAKAKLVSNINKKIHELESLEQLKPNLSKLKSCTTTDEDTDDVGSWRRLKSPRFSEPALKTMGHDFEPKRSKRIPKKTNVPNPALQDSVFQSDDERKLPNKRSSNIKVRIPPKRKIEKVPQVDGYFDTSSSSEDEEFVLVSQLDGADDKRPKPQLKALTPPVSNCTRKHSLRLKTKQPSKVLPKSIEPNTPTDKSPPKISKLKSPLPPNSKTSQKMNSSFKFSTNSTNASTSTLFTPEKTDVRDVIVNLVSTDIRKNKLRASKLSPQSYKEESDSSDFVPPKKKKSPIQVTKVKKRILPRSKLEELEKAKAEMEKQKSKGIDIWVEVYLEEEEKWISADVTSGKVHCIKDIYNKASHPVSYVLTWDNSNRIKDVTMRYSPNWNTITRKLRVDPKWWETSLNSYVGKKTARDREEDEDLARLQLDQPLPKTISEYKDHPLYVLKRHLLKFQALYPSEPAILGMVRNEPVYSRDCVYTLHSRDIWLKYAKVVKLGEQPYKIVKARPKYDKLSNSMITDQLLEIFGVWQVEDYDPPTAENGVVPRNAYGNVELFKPCMLPKKCVHLQLPGLNKIARKLQIDCASAVTGFDFHGGWNHAVYDGFVVCEEFKETLIAAWEKEQEEIVKREQEKYEKRVFGNWRRLIKATLIRERLKRRYDFTDKKPSEEVDDFAELQPEEQTVMEVSPPKKKRPKFMSRK